MLERSPSVTVLGYCATRGLPKAFIDDHLEAGIERT